MTSLRRRVCGDRSAIAFLCVGAIASVAQGQWVMYSGTPGTLPQGQCFAQTIAGTPTQPPLATVVDGELLLSTLSLGTSGENGGTLYWYRDNVDIDFAAGVSMEARLRVTESQYTVSYGGFPRAGYGLTIRDAAGHVVAVGLGSDRVFLMNTFYAKMGDPGTAEIEFDTTDANHTYRVDIAPGGHATLLIDGVPRMSVPLGQVEDPHGHGYASFGDQTYWANSEVGLLWFRFTGVAPPCCSADLNGDGLVDFVDYLEFLNRYDAGC